jgi:hypothetical protein
MAGKSQKTLLEFNQGSIADFDKLKDALRGAEKATPSNAELFLFAMAFGFQAGNRAAISKGSGNGVRVEYLRPEHEVLMAAIQLSVTGSTASLPDLDERYSIAEEFAEGGIRLLSAELAKPGNPIQSFASQLQTVAHSLRVDDRSDE